MENEYFVKFVPFNKWTLDNIKNKKIKFSTVDEFNDVNEMEWVGFPYYPNKNYHENSGKIIKNKPLMSKIQKFLEYKYVYHTKNDEQQATLTKNFKRDFEKDPNNAIYLPEVVNFLLCKSIKIFCLSSVDVFKGEAAKLMLGHYSDSAKGLALVYHYNKSKEKNYLLGKVEYINREEKSVDGVHEGAEDKFLKDYFTNSENISKKSIPLDMVCNKSIVWAYEKEYRLLTTNQLSNEKIECAEKYGLTLKGIFYTDRLVYEDDKKGCSLALMLPDEELKDNVLYLKLTKGRVDYQCKDPQGEIQKEKTIKWRKLKKNGATDKLKPKKGTLEEFKAIKSAILKVTSSRGHTHKKYKSGEESQPPDLIKNLNSCFCEDEQPYIKKLDIYNGVGVTLKNSNAKTVISFIKEQAGCSL